MCVITSSVNLPRYGEFGSQDVAKNKGAVRTSMVDLTLNLLLRCHLYNFDILCTRLSLVISTRDTARACACAILNSLASQA